MSLQPPAAVAALLRAAAERELVLPVEGRSMGATIVAGSEVVVRATPRAPRVSEVWAFCNDDGTVVVHRYRRRLADGRLVFRGDGQSFYDPAVPAAQLIGRVRTARTPTGESRAFGPVERAGFVARRLVHRARRSRA